MKSRSVSENTIERLILFRRLLAGLQSQGIENLYSHQLAEKAGIKPAQLRRDLMAIGYSGTPVKGYDVSALVMSISEFIDAPEKEQVIIVGIGHLGHAVIDYFHGRRQKLEIWAAFDNDSEKVNRVIHGCRCYHSDDLEMIVKEKKITVAIIAVPANEAPGVAERLVKTGIRGLLNYSPVSLQVPPTVYVENRDMITAVEKVAYLARQTL